MDVKDFARIQTRRDFFRHFGGGLETIALAHLMSREGRAGTGELPATNPLAPKPPHFASSAKNVIFLFMAGAPSQIDLYDPKPELAKWHGKALPPSLTKDLQLAFIKPNAKVMASPRKFKKYGQSGLEFSDYIPYIGRQADEICMIRSMHTEAFNHHPGQSLLMTGSPVLGRPTLGSWLTYGLGSESDDLPAFVVLSSGKGASGGSTNWSSGFLPSTYQGVPFRSSGEPILYLDNPPGVKSDTQRARLDAIRKLNEQRYHKTGDVEIASRIQSYELAFRMQTSGPELLDFSQESPKTLEMYGVGKEPTDPYATNCLLARRMVERGVRYVMLVHGSWDNHQEIDERLAKNTGITDKPISALIKDLKRRDLLDETLVVWAGEFGRTPMGEIERADEAFGRDHHPNCFTIWMAGGGIKGGQVIGKTDEIGLNVAEEPIHIHDLQATILNRMGLEHTKLIYRHLGRDSRLTDVGGNVIQKALA